MTKSESDDLTSSGAISDRLHRSEGRADRAEARERATRDLLEESEASGVHKDLLMREVSHRVRNSLQLVGTLLWLQGTRIGDPASRQLFAEAADRINIIANIHQRLYALSSVELVEFGAFLRALCADFEGTMSDGRQISILVHADTAHLVPEQATSLGLIANELITNAVKYGYSNQQSGTSGFGSMRSRMSAGPASRTKGTVCRKTSIRRGAPASG